MTAALISTAIAIVAGLALGMACVVLRASLDLVLELIAQRRAAK